MKRCLTIVTRARCLLRAAILLSCVVPFTAGAAEATGPADVEGEPPIRMKADELSYDRDLGVVTATGQVEVSHDGRILMADTLSYNQRADLLSASGNITLLEPSGEVIFARYLELTGNLKEGVIQDFRMILQDGARIAASGGRRTDGNKTEMYNTVYSPCNLCPDDPSKPPLWQVKAVRVIHDKEWQTVEYRDAWLEVAGVPVIYTPYLRHPDPTAKRETGFLPPSIGGSTDLGMVFEAPFYWNIAPNMDATFRPTYTTKEGPGLAGEFRSIFDRKKFDISGSITEDSDDKVRGHLRTEGLFDIDETWRWGLNVNRASDDTYLRRYGYGSESTLTSNVFVEGFRHRNYLSAQGYAFQGLSSADVSGDTPLVLPMMEYSYIGQPDAFGGRPSMDLNFQALTRDSGMDTRRMSALLGWELPYITSSGSHYTLATELQGDLYHVNGLKRTNKDTFNGVSYRISPRIGLEWRHPFVREEGTGSVYQVVEPVVSAVYSPNGGNPDDIPNEDSQATEFDDTNLFTMNRFSGLDRVEGGPRLNYGLNWGVYGRSGGSTVFRVGQSLRLREDDTFADGSGLEDNFSDIVGSVQVQPGEFLNAFYRTRLSKDDLSAKRNELAFSVGPKALKFSSNYIFFDREEGSEFKTREQLSSTLSARFTRYWRGSVSGLRDLVDDEMRSLRIGLIYEDECLTFETQATRTFYEDRDLKPTDAILFTVTFKTLGEIHTGITQR